MGSDLIAWVVGITLGLAVVGLGLRRDLGDVTRSWLPRFGEGPEQATASGSLNGGQGRRQPSPRQRRLAIWANLLIGIGYSALAVLSANDRLWHAIFAALFVVWTVVLMLKGRHPPASQARASSR
jgi:hypothetical protein